MSRPQASGFSSTKQQLPDKAKTKAVHKEAAFRQVASEWTLQSKEVQGLDVLERCKNLNAFLCKVRDVCTHVYSASPVLAMHYAAHAACMRWLMKSYFKL